MGHKDSLLSTNGSERRWAFSTPTSPLEGEASSQGVAGGGGGGSGSHLAPYNPGGGSVYPSTRPVAVRKIRIDISAEEKQEICMAFELFDSRKVGKHNARDLKKFDSVSSTSEGEKFQWRVVIFDPRPISCSTVDQVEDSQSRSHLMIEEGEEASPLSESSKKQIC